MSSMENPDSTEPDSASAARPEIYDRVDHVLNGLQSLLPSQMSPQMSILTEIIRGMRRDISIVPEDQVQQFMRSIGEACVWIADGSMADLTDPEEDEDEDDWEDDEDDWEEEDDEDEETESAES